MSKPTKKRAQPPTKVPPEADPKVQEYQRRLLISTTKLIFKIATCKCGKRENCAVYNVSREIAAIVDKLQELRPVPIETEQVVRGRPTGTV